MYKIVIKVFLLILALQLTLQARIINIDNIINSAKKSDKHLFVWLHKTDCGYCENMREFTLENEIIQAFIDQNFIFVHINVYEKDSIKYQDFRGNGLEFAKDIGYNFYPSSLFFSHDGELVLSEVGFIDKDKEPNEERFYRILNFIESKSYENINFSDYKFKIDKEL
ncbi:MAG: thioredoxin family protein [Campylobacterota bacterium]|nr:thioredoxin family protein [Campylobacterota bacterium]